MTTTAASSTALANDIIKKHVLYSMGAGLVPFPIIDMAAVSAVQLDMLKQLCRLFGVDYSEASGKAFAGVLAGSTLARIFASFIKAIPGIGTLLGGVSMALMSGASTYALGQVFLQHVALGGSWSDFDFEKGKAAYSDLFEEGKEKAAHWSKEQKLAGKSDFVTELKHLAELKDKGILTEEEFQKMKDKLMGQV
jgi:uncharacterized protein (DUF697 family)